MECLEDTAKRLVSIIDLMHQVGMRDAADRDINISPGAIHVLRHALENPGAGVMDIAVATGLAKPTVSLIVKDLVAKGVFRREGGLEDARRVHLYLTEAGERVIHSVQEYRRQKAKMVLAVLGEGDLATMGELMAKILDYRRRS